MTWEPRPVPPVTPETEPFWSGWADDVFRIMECRACESAYFYPRAFCPFCFSDDVAWLDAGGTGEVYTYSVTDRVADWPDEYLPLVVAMVELGEGPRIITNIVDCDPDEVTIGTNVEVTFVSTDENDVAIPVFSPTRSD